jgi:hypothetical protein
MMGGGMPESLTGPTEKSRKNAKYLKILMWSLIIISILEMILINAIAGN